MTLAGVCKLIARYARRPVVRPARFFGGNCGPAGVFLTVRSWLCDDGACAADIAPSTPLAPYVRRYNALFLGPISRLAPGALPLVRIRTPIYDAAVWGLLAGIVSIVVGACSGLDLLKLVGGLVFAGAYAATWIAARGMLPASVEFGGLQTFRDLAVVLAHGGLAAQPSPECGAGGGGRAHDVSQDNA
jgi:hypothetical protein